MSLNGGEGRAARKSSFRFGFGRDVGSPGIVFPSEPLVVRVGGHNGAEQAGARRCWARRSEPLPASTVVALEILDERLRWEHDVFLLVGLESWWFRAEAIEEAALGSLHLPCGVGIGLDAGVAFELAGGNGWPQKCLPIWYLL